MVRNWIKIDNPKQFKKEFDGLLNNYEASYQNLQTPARKTKGSAGYDVHTVIGFTLSP